MSASKFENARDKRKWLCDKLCEKLHFGDENGDQLVCYEKLQYLIFVKKKILFF